MSNFYSLDDAGKTPSFQRLVEQALPLWGMSGARAAIIKQRENAVFSLQCADGTRAVMRVHRAGYHSNAELHSELQWMKALDAFGVHTPAVIPALDGELFKTVSVPAVPEPRQVDVLAWVDGKDIGSIEAGLGDLATARKNYRLIGQLVAGMHDFSSRWELPRDFRVTPGTRPACLASSHGGGASGNSNFSTMRVAHVSLRRGTRREQSFGPTAEPRTVTD